MAFNVDFLASYDIDSLTAELRRIAGLTGKNTVTSTDINRFGRVNLTTIYLKFGSIGHANEAAGLAFSLARRLTNLEILRMLADLWKRTLQEDGRRPHKTDLKRYGLPFSCDIVLRRFGTWKKALLAANDLADHDASAPPVVSKRRTPISVRRRFRIFKRDNYECQICHRTDEPLEVDHIVPACHGGSDESDNLQTLCWDCNRGKGGNLQ
jgi:5-methylcytosine-specific restriction endonuclease McrA